MKILPEMYHWTRKSTLKCKSSGSGSFLKEILPVRYTVVVYWQC